MFKDLEKKHEVVFDKVEGMVNFLWKFFYYLNKLRRLHLLEKAFTVLIIISPTRIISF